VNRELRTALAFLAVGCLAVPCFAAGRTAPPAPAKADRILVLKSERKLILMRDGKPLKTYKVALGGEPVGPKARRGDHKTPEGTYTVDRRNIHSQFHKSLHVSYPSAADAANAHKLHASPGGDIMIHGLPNGWGWLGSAHLAHDWTDGCIAVTDEEIEEIWKLVPDGTPIEIKP
jgi:murein L,D-transpeptidase YafK